MSVIHKNSMSASGSTWILKSGFECLAISLRLIFRTRSTTLRSRKGMHVDGRNVNDCFMMVDADEWIEVPQRLDFIPEEFHTNRPGAGQGKQVENASTQGDFTLLSYLCFGFVAVFLKPFHEIERLHLMTNPDRPGTFLE